MDHAAPELAAFRTRMRFWLAYARRKHGRDVSFLLRTAKLKGKPHKVNDQWFGWNNVFKHQVAQAAAFCVLARALELPADQAERQERFALLHDALKRSERAPADFSVNEFEELNGKLSEIFAEIDPTGALRVATSEEFFYRIFERTPGSSLEERFSQTPFDELLQYFIDSIFLGPEIMSPLTRIARTEVRRQDLNEDDDRTRRLGMRYWDAERALAVWTEKLISERLKQINGPMQSDVHAFLRQELENTIRAGIEP